MTAARDGPEHAIGIDLQLARLLRGARIGVVWIDGAVQLRKSPPANHVRRGVQFGDRAVVIRPALGFGVVDEIGAAAIDHDAVGYRQGLLLTPVSAQFPAAPPTYHRVTLDRSRFGFSR